VTLGYHHFCSLFVSILFKHYHVYDHINFHQRLVESDAAQIRGPMDATSSRANLESLVAAQRGRDALESARDGERNDREGNRGNQHTSTGRIAYTLTACCRCRQVTLFSTLSWTRATQSIDSYSVPFRFSPLGPQL